MSLADKLCRSSVQQLTPYASARRIGGQGSVWINANELPHNMTFNGSLTRLNRYPEFQPPQLLSAYSDYCKIKTENILLTRGADEGIELLIRTFCEAGQDSIAFCPPTYGMYKISAETCGVNYQEIALSKNLDLPNNLDKLVSTDVNILFLCNPNNPTGSLISNEQFEHLLSLTKETTIVVVDEAYIDFCPEQSIVRLIAKYPNLVVLRTLSKAFGLAGLRCGFVLADSSIIACLKKVIAPYPVPTPVATIATQALSATGLKVMQQHVEKINTDRAQLTSYLCALSSVDIVLKSSANFITVRFHNADNIWKTLIANGIVARNMATYIRLENCIRFTIGTTEEMQQLCNVLRQTDKEYTQ